jgi:hypothetical protein
LRSECNIIIDHILKSILVRKLIPAVSFGAAVKRDMESREIATFRGSDVKTGT